MRLNGLYVSCAKAFPEVGYACIFIRGAVEVKPYKLSDLLGAEHRKLSPYYYITFSEFSLRWSRNPREWTYFAAMGLAFTSKEVPNE